jgi:hypothetical protein
MCNVILATLSGVQCCQHDSSEVLMNLDHLAQGVGLGHGLCRAGAIDLT